MMVSVAAVLSGCAVSARLGETPASEAPQLVAGNLRDASGRIVYEWNRPDAFGKVSGRQKVLGDATCLMARVDLEALGYHPSAMDAEGQLIPGGGYLCGVKATGNQPGEQAPTLVRSNGVLGWNEPRLFGVVPLGQQARGDALCAKVQTRFEAVAYHPRAQDEAGQMIEGGGFFCAPKRSSARVMGSDGEVLHKSSV